MTRKSRGILTVVSGFSGAGKGSIMKELLSSYAERYALSVSATTRKPRPGETDGVEYFFKTREEFEQMIAEDELIEYTEYVGNYYGTPKSYVEKQLNDGKDVILEIEIHGALQIKEKFSDTLLLFVTAPTAEELKHRLIGRGTESVEVIESRLERAVEESEGIEAYDYLVINDVLCESVDEVHHIIQNEHYKVSRNLEAIYEMRSQLKGFAHQTDVLKGEL
ncbi:MAG: guanylate kinase [Clostridiales bacterium]|nr:guanylate kinase [Clostridiales bacterium]